MSLLNDALRDLDRSGRTSPEHSAKVLTVAESKASFAKYRLPILAVLVVVAWLVVEADVLGLMPETNAAKAASALSPAAGSPAASPSPRVEVAQTQKTQPQTEQGASLKPNSTDGISSSTPAAVVPQERPAYATALPGHSDPITKLLSEAARAVQQDHLMSPPGNNAFHLYRSVLLLEPGNAEALSGIAAIIERYLQLAGQALDEQNTAAAKLYLQRAQTAGARPQQLDAFRSVLVERQKGAVTTTEIASGNEALGSDRKAVGSHKDAISRNKNAISFDRDADLAQRLRAHPSQYEHKAWLRVNGEEASHATAMALADVYAAGNDLAQLQKLKQTLAENASRAQHYVQAHWLIASGDLGAAAQALSAVSSVQGENVFYLRLLAGVHAALNDYTQALPIYQQLLQAPEFHLNDWLGYALALERVGEHRGALQAYQKISGIRHSDPRINEYVQARIRDLVGDLSGR